MATRLNPYLNFANEAGPAMEFYQSVFGGELTQNTYGELQLSHGPDDDAKIMHSVLDTPNGLTLMAADSPSDLEPGTNGSISVSGDDEAELRGYWDKLSDGGTVTYPLAVAPWGDTFGMCTDKYGISWLVNIAGSPS
ncbi:MAG TPA: VOC family protein [Jatrophihabitantaceae bacterium]|jgi:PhnB protein